MYLTTYNHFRLRVFTLSFHRLRVVSGFFLFDGRVYKALTIEIVTNLYTSYYFTSDRLRSTF